MNTQIHTHAAPKLTVMPKLLGGAVFLITVFLLVPMFIAATGR